MIISAFATHPGLVREQNEDSVHSDDALGIYILADGIGGHNAGEVASALAIETVYTILRANIAHTETDGYFELMTHAIQTAHWEIHAKAQASPEFARMGTTLVVMVLQDNKAYVAHAGDSRCYLFYEEPRTIYGSLSGGEEGRLLRLTSDHTAGDHQLALGVPIEQIPPKKFHMLTQSVGCGDPPYPDFNVADFSRGDKLLLCSDGLTDMLGDAEIETILATDDASLDSLVAELVDAANAKGGRDNISVVLATLP